MNKTVQYKYESFSKKTFAQAVLILVDREPEFYESYKSHYDEKERLPDPIPLVKFVIRLYFLFEYGDQKKTLKQLKEITDPYETITFDKFYGRFAYDYDEKGFLPVYVETKGTHVMKKIWDKIELKRVHRAWDQAQKYVSDPNGGEPELIYVGEPT